MAEAETLNPSRDDFAAMLDASFNEETNAEGSVVKGKIIAIENDLAIIDVGLKTEGRVPLREFRTPGEDKELVVGDEVEVFLDRIENAMGEAVLSRDKARREEAWVRLEKSFERQRSRRRRDLWPRQGRLHRGPWRRRCVPARFAGRHPPGA
jgi:small subunit ribosomal protein S1